MNESRVLAIEFLYETLVRNPSGVVTYTWSVSDSVVGFR